MKMFNIVVISFIMLATMFSVPAVRAEEPWGILNAIVLEYFPDSEDLVGLPGALVTLTGPGGGSNTTDETGFCVIKFTPNAEGDTEYFAKATKKGYNTASGRFTLKEGQHIVVMFFYMSKDKDKGIIDDVSTEAIVSLQQSLNLLAAQLMNQVVNDEQVKTCCAISNIDSSVDLNLNTDSTTIEYSTIKRAEVKRSSSKSN